MRISKESIAKQVFGSGVKRRILEFLTSNQEPVSERELARIIGVSNTAVNKAMRQLFDMNIVRARSIGASMIWELDEDSFAFPYVKAYIEASGISPLEYIKRTIRDGFDMINGMTAAEHKNRPLIREAYIFGSVADGTATPESDVDVLVILDFDCRNDALKNALQGTVGKKIMEKMGNRVSFHIYSLKAVKEGIPNWLGKSISTGIRVL